MKNLLVFGICYSNYGDTKQEVLNTRRLSSMPPQQCPFISHFVSTKKACELPPYARDHILNDKKNRL